MSPIRRNPHRARCEHPAVWFWSIRPLSGMKLSKTNGSSNLRSRFVLIVLYNCLLACVALLSTIGRSEGARGEVENGSS